MKLLPILLVLPSYAGGGAERVIINLIENIDNNLFDPYLVMQNTKGPLKCDISEKKIIDLSASKFRYALLPLIKEINRVKPTIVLSTFPHITISLLIFRKLLPRDTIILGREPNMPSSSLSHRPFSFIFKRLYNNFMPNIDGVIATSIAMKKELICRGIAKNKISIIYNPIHMDKIRKSLKAVRFGGKGLRLVFVGRLVYQKGLDRILPILKDIKDIHLTIIGEGSEDIRLKNIVCKLDITNKVTFLGHVNIPYPYMAGADYFILPSRWEGLPNVVLEALALGTPVVCMKEIKGLKEIKSLLPKNKLYFCNNIEELYILMLKLPIRNDYKKPIVRPPILTEYNSPGEYSKKVSSFMKKIAYEKTRN